MEKIHLIDLENHIEENACPHVQYCFNRYQHDISLYHFDLSIV